MKAKQWMGTFLLCGCVSMASAQDNAASQPEFKPSGKAIGKVFWNFNHNFTEGVDKKNSFELQRAYFGYSYNFSQTISAKILLDAARSITANGTDPQTEYNTFLKNAQLDWKLKPEATLSFGMIGLKQFDTQENFMGFRYVYKDFQDEFTFGTTVDLGANIEYVFSPKVTTNLFVINGEGFTKKQDKYGKMKFGANIIVQPIKGLTLKAYGSLYEGQEIYGSSVLDSTSAMIQNYDLFAGYKGKKFRVGLEYDMMLDGSSYYVYAKDHNSSGVVLFGAYTINDKFEVFGHLFDYTSNKIDGATTTWNEKRDGSSGLIGFQYIPVKGLKSSINYRTFVYDKDGSKDDKLVYLNFEYSF
jgi:hypothetical protein